MQLKTKPPFKRFFNQQALYRNSMYNDFSARLTNFGIKAEDVVLKDLIRPIDGC